MTSQDEELARVARAYESRGGGRENARYAWSNPSYVAYAQRLERAVLSALATWPRGLDGSRVLDIGCGSGYLLHRLLEYGAASASGVDLMADRIDDARSRYPVLDLHVGSATDLPFPDASFDLVSQFTCLTSVLDGSVRQRIAEEMWRVVRPGGTILSFDMMPSPGRRAAEAIRRRREAGGAPVHTPTRPLSEGELDRFFPGRRLAQQTLGASVGLGPVARVPGAELVSGLPPLRTHLLMLIERTA